MRPDLLEPPERLDPRRPIGNVAEDDREEAVLDEVAGEEHTRVADEHDLVAGRVRAALLAQGHGAPAEVELGRPDVGVVRLHELDPLERRGDLGAEGAEHLHELLAALGELGGLTRRCRRSAPHRRSARRRSRARDGSA